MAAPAPGPVLELRGLGFLNRGAELMLLAILARFAARSPALRFALAPRPEAPFEARARLGLLQKFELRFRGLPLHGLGRGIPPLLRTRYGLVLDGEVGAVLDGSGFAYSDQWGVLGRRRCEELAYLAKRCARRGAPLILLPQAFGPFRERATVRAMGAVLAQKPLVFARDRASEAALLALGGDPDRILRAPDFTNLLPAADLGAEGSVVSNGFFMVPNARLVDRGQAGARDAYLSLLTRFAEGARRQGLAPFFLLHEGEGDRALAEAVNARLAAPLAVVTALDPRELKAHLGGACGGLADRYHALVGALSQGVPAYAVGWSHKYGALFEDYAWPEGLLPCDLPPEGVETCLAALGDPNRRGALSARLAAAAAAQRAASEAMWTRVEAELAKAGLLAGAAS